jgi:glutamyl-tRNA synthetase
MIEHFSLERVQKAPASFDPQKLFAFQQRHMQVVPIKQKVALVLPFLQQAGLVTSPPPCDIGPRLTRIVEAAADRIKVAGDILDFTEFFVADDELTYDEAAFDKRIRKANAGELLAKLNEQLAQVEPFDAPSTDRAVHAFVEQQGIKIGDIIHALRVAITGKSVGLGMFEALAILGRDSSRKRIARAVKEVGS